MRLNSDEILKNKLEFINLLNQVKRPGIDKLIQWLEKSDFFEAPSSANYHSSFKGGLCFHSLNVYKAAIKLKKTMEDLALPENNFKNITDESIILCTLLHDLCKVNFYDPIIKTWKDETAPIGQQWKKYLSYEINDKLPISGHGSKSVMLIMMFGIQMSAEEIAAINWHMGMTDIGTYMSPYEKPAFSKAINDIPHVVLLMEADVFASFMMEPKFNQKKENLLE